MTEPVVVRENGDSRRISIHPQGGGPKGGLSLQARRPNSRLGGSWRAARHPRPVASFAKSLLYPERAPSLIPAHRGPRNPPLLASPSSPPLLCLSPVDGTRCPEVLGSEPQGRRAPEHTDTGPPRTSSFGPKGAPKRSLLLRTRGLPTGNRSGPESVTLGCVPGTGCDLVRPGTSFLQPLGAKPSRTPPSALPAPAVSSAAPAPPGHLHARSQPGLGLGLLSSFLKCFRST